MKELTNRGMSLEEYTSRLRKELKTDGLYKAVEKRCTEINEECNDMGYVQHRTIQEWLIEILDLIILR